MVPLSPLARPLILLMAGLACPPAFGAPIGTVPASAFEESLAEIRALGSRRENSEGERAALDLVERRLDAAGLKPVRRGFDDVRDDASASETIEARIAGLLPDELALIVPINSWTDATADSDGAAGLALALTEAESLGERRASGWSPPISLRFVFLGAERRGRMGEGGEASLGSRAWISRNEGAAPLAVIYLALDEAPTRVSLMNAGRGLLSPLWYYDRARIALGAAGLPVLLEANRLQVYRLGLADRYGPVSPYLEAGMPAVEIRNEPSSADATSRTRAGPWFSAFIDEMTRANSGGFEDIWDRTYLILQAGNRSAVLRETFYVAFLVVFGGLVAAVVLAVSVVKRRAAKALLSRGPVILGQLLAIFASVFAVFLVGQGWSRLDAAALGSADAWMLAPRLFAGARILACFVLFLSLLSLLVERKALSPNPYFYEFASLICLGINVLFFSAILPSASYYFVWAFAIVGLSLALRKPWATVVAYLAMYAPLAPLAYELASKPETAVYSKLLAPATLDTLALSALALPFFAFTASPLLFYAPPEAIARKRVAAILALCAIAIEGAALAYAAYGPAHPAPPGGRTEELVVSEAIDQDAGRFTAKFEAERRLGKTSITRGGELIELSSLGDRAEAEGNDREKRIAVSNDRVPFLDRASERIRIDFLQPPYRVEILLTGERDLGIFDCTIPYQASLDGKSAALFVPVNPGNRIEIEITVPGDFEASLAVKAEYLAPPVPYRYGDGSAPKPGRFEVKASTLLSEPIAP
jgi:hypothetical protein